MATGTENLLLQGVSGRLGKSLVIKQYAGRIVISAYPHMNTKKKPGRRQKINRDQFREAVAYAKRIMRPRDEEALALKQQYELCLKPGQRLYHYLVSMYLRLVKAGNTVPGDHKKG